MPTVDELKAEFLRLEAAAKDAQERDDPDAALEIVEQAMHAYKKYEAAKGIAQLAALSAKGLQPRDQGGTLGHMDMNHALATSVAKGKGDAAFTAARKAKGMTLEDVAKGAKMSLSALKMARTGRRSIPEEKANAIAKFLDWPATRANWPGGIA